LLPNMTPNAWKKKEHWLSLMAWLALWPSSVSPHICPKVSSRRLMFPSLMTHEIRPLKYLSAKRFRP